MTGSKQGQLAPLLKIKDLETHFTAGEQVVKAVDGISLEIAAGETLGLVGESGSGKSVTSLSILRLLPEGVGRIEGGSISYLGRDLVRVPGHEMRPLRGKDISMIFQEPGTSLNPVFKVGHQVMEVLQLHQGMSKRAARQRAVELFDEVGIPDAARRIGSYPHEMSGGQKQRVMIAMALSCNPRLLIADEPTTALDVTIQAQILDLLRKLRDERGMAILFITHDLGVIAEIADRVAVMYQGRIVESGPLLEIFEHPEQPYTKGLLACRPRLESSTRRLPTVADFMAERDPSRESQSSENAPIERGRDPLLHPLSELLEMGYDNAAVASMGADHIGEDVQPLIRVRDLSVHFPIRKGVLRRVSGAVRAVDGIGFDVYQGQTLGLVGESGCGKTTTGLALLRLLKPTTGSIQLRGQETFSARGRDLHALRRSMQIVLQDPYASLNPRLSVKSMLVEAMSIHGLGGTAQQRVSRAGDLLEEVGLERSHLLRYPHEFSGGQRQRISIARALAVEPEFLVLDESVSALDVSVQAQVLNLLKDLQEERGLTYVFISHDLSVVKFMSDMMAVMHDGKIVEYGPAELIYRNPRSDYTAQLIESVPDDSLASIRTRIANRARRARDRSDVARGGADHHAIPSEADVS